MVRILTLILAVTAVALAAQLWWNHKDRHKLEITALLVVGIVLTIFNLVITFSN
ncbi:MAG: hypothetical protein OXB95_06430 [Rhodobacteraceae bacterium]|nr:hypothetical protein [Paracoccaceae bacterium]